MSVSLAYLEQCSAETGFGITGLEKVVRLGAMAGEIGRHRLLSKALALFRGRFLALAGTLDQPLDTYTERRLAERTTQRAVDEQLVPMLGAGAEVRAAELVGAAWSRLAPLITLGDEERGFVERLQRGELDLSLLFPDDPIEAARITAHPALRWKAQNARSHHDRR